MSPSLLLRRHYELVLASSRVTPEKSIIDHGLVIVGLEKHTRSKSERPRTVKPSLESGKR
jgi:hypothetical protein